MKVVDTERCTFCKVLQLQEASRTNNKQIGVKSWVSSINPEGNSYTFFLDGAFQFFSNDMEKSAECICPDRLKETFRLTSQRLITDVG